MAQSLRSLASVYMIMGCALSQVVLIPNLNLLLLVYNTFLGTSQISSLFLLSRLSELSGTLWNSTCHLLQIGRSIKIVTWSATINFFFTPNTAINIFTKLNLASKDLLGLLSYQIKAVVMGNTGFWA